MAGGHNKIIDSRKLNEPNTRWKSTFMNNNDNEPSLKHASFIRYAISTD